MTRTRWIIFAVIAILVLGGLVFLSTRNRVDVSNIDGNAIYTAEEGISDHVIGDPESSVVLIEYGDFQCPGCREAAPKLKPLVEHYSDHIAFTYRHFPLTNIHPNALAAATAAEAAGLQDKFYEMHDLLFNNQASWKDASAESRTDIFRGYAEQLNLDADAFIEALSSAEISEKIRRDQSLARTAGATSTPTIILNGEMVNSDSWSRNTVGLERQLRDAIAATGQELPKPMNALDEDNE